MLGKGAGVEAGVINALGGRKKGKMMKENGQRGRNQERMEEKEGNVRNLPYEQKSQLTQRCFCKAVQPQYF